MRTQHFKNAGFAHRHVSSSTPSQHSGWITELRYSEQPGMMQMLLLPLLQQLSQESRWQLWLTPAHKLNRAWLQQSGLPLEKSMHVADSERCTSVEAMIKALRTGNYSVVLAWIPYDLDEEERRELEQAAAEGQALGLIMRTNGNASASRGPEKGLKIQSDLFH
ncbi:MULTISPECIES: SOS-induced cell division inhibitor SulA [Pantoea]|jgi:cell division inhibitor SulA|uniref:Cell division inhibitor SulA n=1 Tax=Pantoea latae TaxID=1964541 RepID=A0A1V9DPL1_9GAMM|nr:MULTISPECIES: SOS-induced cell division inhibitor SulA [Pantoea]OQP35776.1 cell division inhibitor SulA [Pantoea latae]